MDTRSSFFYLRSERDGPRYSYSSVGTRQLCIVVAYPPTLTLQCYSPRITVDVGGAVAELAQRGLEDLEGNSPRARQRFGVFVGEGVVHVGFLASLDHSVDLP